MSEDEMIDPRRERHISNLMSLIEGQFRCKGKNHEFTSSVKQIFLTTLRPLPEQLASKLVTAAILTCPFLPCAADIWQPAIDAACPTVPRAEAWNQVRRVCGLFFRPKVCRI